MTQQWRDLAFLHWAYDPEVVARLLPAGVELDLYQGQAYVALVPFNMVNLRVRGLPRIPTTSNFPEINVRTYVRSRGRPAVWFFSLDTPQLLPTLVARTAFKLPYCFASATVTVAGIGTGAVMTSHVQRRWPKNTGGSLSSLAIKVGSPIEPDEFATFVTARWGLVSASPKAKLWYGPIEHEPWPLHTGELLHLDDTLIQAAGLPAPQGEPHILFSPGVHTTIFSLQRLN